MLVRRLQRLGDLLRDEQRLLDRDRTLRDAVGERGPFDELQDQHPRPVRVLEAVDGSDIGVTQRGQRLRLALEPREPFGIMCERLRQDLDRDVPLELRVPCPVDFAHPATADEGDDFVRADAQAAQSHVTLSARAAWACPSRAVREGCAAPSPRKSSCADQSLRFRLRPHLGDR